MNNSVGDGYRAIFDGDYDDSRVRLFVHEAKRKVRIFFVSCRSAMNLVRGSLFAVAMRNSGSVWRSAFAIRIRRAGCRDEWFAARTRTNPKRGWGATTARHWSSPWARPPACRPERRLLIKRAFCV